LVERVAVASISLDADPEAVVVAAGCFADCGAAAVRC
jgi:hypothetical protein